MPRTILLHPHPISAARERLTSDHTLLSPNRAAAERLGRPYADLRSVAADRLPEGWRLASHLTRRQLLRAQVRRVWRSLRPEQARAWVEPSVVRVLRAGLTPDQLRAGQPEQRVQQLADVLEGYLEALRARCFIDPAEANWWAQADEPLQLLASGWARLNRDELRLLDTVSAEGSVVILPALDHSLFDANREAAAWLAEQEWTIEIEERSPGSLGATLSRDWLLPRGETAGGAEVTAWATPAAEAEGVLGRVKQLIVHDHVSPSQIVLVVRNEAEWAPLLASVARQVGVPVRLNHMVGLRETRLGAWLVAALGAVVDGLPYEATLRLLRTLWHGSSQAAEQQAEAKRNLPRGDAWAEYGAWPVLLNTPADDDPATAWLKWLDDLLQGARSLRSRDAREALAGAALERACAQAASEVGDATWSAKDCAAQLADWLDLLSVPAQPGRGGVAVHTPLAMLGGEREYVFILGARDGAWPGEAKDDSFLDFIDREAINNALGEPRLETASAAGERESAVLWSTLCVPTRLLSVNYSTADRHELSRWWDPLALRSAPAVPLLASAPAWRRAALRLHEVAPDEALMAAREAWDVETRREGPEPPNAHDGVVGPGIPTPPAFSASSLRSLASCPFQWFAKYILRLGEDEELAPDPSALTKGTVFHDTLHLLLLAAARLGWTTDPARRAQLVAPSLEAVVGGQLGDDEASLAVAEARTAWRDARRAEAEAAGREWLDDDERGAPLTRLPNWPRLRAEWTASLQDAVRSDDFVLADHEPHEFEVAFTGFWSGFPIRGRLDRIDLINGELQLIDYKLGKTAPKAIKRPDWEAFDLQAAIYLQGFADPLARRVAGGHYLLANRKRSAWSAPDGEGPVQEFATWALARLNQGDYPVAPCSTPDPCQYCEYTAVCRRGPRLERKGSVVEDSE